MRRVTSVIGLALTLMVLLVVPGSTGAPEVVGASPVVAKITFTDAIGNPVDHAKVTDLGNGWLSIPNAQLVDDSVAGVLDHEQLFEAVLVALTDVNNLRQWQLCAAELTYGAEKSQASGDAVIKFPLDRPSHYPDTPADLTRKAGLHYRYASALYKAAELADDYGIECTKPPVTEYAHMVILTMPVDGVMRQVRVPEHEVVLPLEYFMQNGECLPEAQAEYTRLAKKPIDVKPDPKGGYFTFSERDKYRCVMHQAAYLKLLRATGVNRTC